MKIYSLNTQSDFNQGKLCLTVGNFDGIHRGHQYIIKKITKLADENKLQSAILSFNPHPKIFFNNSEERFNILTKEKKLIFLKQFGISIYLDFNFNLQLASLSAEDFVKNILVKKLGIKIIVIGTDFRFGKDRAGDLNLLNELSKKCNFKVVVIEPITIQDSNDKYSSTKIRDQIKKGLFEEVNCSLGYIWQMSGKVIRGDRRAGKMNIPTANIVPPDQILPLKGVYCVNAIIDHKKYSGISNFGERPTVDGSKLLLETHIFDFNEDIYGKELTVEFLTFIRVERKFENFKKLTEQITKDIITAKTYHKI